MDLLSKRELTDTTGVDDYVKVTGGPRGNGGGGCWSMLGRRGGVQHLNLNERNEHCGRTCIIKEVVAHEFLHAFGLGHVHSRPDRDDYIEVEFDNIAAKSQFRKMDDALTFGVPYDGRSIMHYAWKDFAIDELRPTMLSKVISILVNR